MTQDEASDIPQRTFKDCLVYLFLLGLIVRTVFLAWQVHTPAFGVPTLDQKYYDTVARMMLGGEDLHLLHGLRPLLYPMFLAVSYQAGGARGIDLAVALQHLFGVLTGVLVAVLGARLFRRRLSGLAGGTLYLLAPVPLFFEGELLVESSYVLLICLNLLLILRAIDAAGGRAGLWWPLCGALTALAAQERSNILVLMAVYPLLAVRGWRRSRQGGALWPLLGLLGGLAMAIPWGFVNKMQSGHFMLMSSEGGENLYLGNQRGSDGITRGLDRYVNYNDRYEDPGEVWTREEYAAAMRAQGRQPDPNPMAVSHYWMGRALEEIKADPPAWLRLMAKKCWILLWNAEVPNNKSFAFQQAGCVWLRLLPVRWVVLLMLAPAGIWAAARRGNRDALWVLLFFAAIYSAVNVAFFVIDRYRYPIWPVMAAFAGGGLAVFIQTLRHRLWRQALGLAAGMGLMAAISLPNWFGAKLPSFQLDYRLRSIAWYEKGNLQEALRDIDRCLELGPDDTAALHHRGNILLGLDRFKEARQDYERTLKFISGDGGLWNNYGAALDGLGLTNEALQAYRRATQCRPPSENAFLRLALELIHRGRLEEAAQALEQLEKLDPRPNPMALAVRSVLARQRGQATQADALERQARALDADAAGWAMKQATNKAPSK